MAVFIDGFDLYVATGNAIPDARLNAKWGASALTQNGAVTCRSGRYTGSKGISITGNGTSATQLDLAFSDASADHVYVIFNVSKNASQGSNCSLRVFLGNSDFIDIEYLTTGDQLRVVASDGATPTTFNLTTSNSDWKTIEIDFDMLAVNFKVYVNDDLVATKNFSSYGGHIIVKSTSATSNIVIDDFAAFRSNDTSLNALQGRNFAIESLLPNADVAGGGWDPSTGTDLFDLVNDIPPNDATYIQALDVGDKQLFGLPNLTNLVSAKCVQLTGRFQDVGATGSQPQFQVGDDGNSTYTNAGGAITMADGNFADKFLILEADPRDTGAWSVAKVNTLRVGCKVAA